MENLRDWAREEKTEERKKRTKLFKSKFDPKRPPAYSTFSRNIPQEVASKPARKPVVPKRTVQSSTVKTAENKNFIVANAVEVILGAKQFKEKTGKLVAKRKEMERYVNKKDYGQRPKYLDKVKEQIEMENEILREYMDEAQMSSYGGPAVESIPAADVEALIKDLKRKWGVINKSYQKTCGGAESASKNRLKEKYEREMKVIENDIQVLAKGNVKVLVDDY